MINKIYFVIIITMAVVLGGCRKNDDMKFEVPETIKVTSSGFENNAELMDKYTCDGENVNPALMISGVPEEAKSLVLTVDDPDAVGGDWNHWLVWNIDPKTTEIKENSVPEGAVEGKTSWGKPGYRGACPPFGTHRYIFKILAVDKKIDLPDSTERDGVEREIEGHVLAKGKIAGLYAKK